LFKQHINQQLRYLLLQNNALLVLLINKLSSVTGVSLIKVYKFPYVFSHGRYFYILAVFRALGGIIVYMGLQYCQNALEMKLKKNSLTSDCGVL
jgi:hypothetical protein